MDRQIEHRVEHQHQLSGISVDDLRRGLRIYLPAEAKLTFATISYGEEPTLLLRWTVPPTPDGVPF